MSATPKMYNHPSRGLMLRPGQACDECRAIKGRCVRTPTAGPSNIGATRPACNRCLRMGTACIVSQGSRARRAPVSNTSSIARESRSVERLREGIDNVPHIQAFDSRPSSTKTINTSSGRSQSQNHTDSDYRPYEQPHLHQLDIDAHLDPGAHPPESDHNNNNNNSNLAIKTFAGDGFLLSENQRAMRYDPEVLGILEEVEIRWLFDQFTRLLSPLIVLLDPELHTLAFVREEQPTLFLAIMFAATRFFHPTAHPLIKQLLETKISESTKTGNCHIATIQAIIILVFWQEPKDRSVWLKSGLAIRMAYQAGLNRTPGMSTLNRSISDIRRLRV
ncbi:hypothetical protein HD553DRAFT_37676 [Filobasidium floriforme]|nr:uncharacterized protein HD553DRAFT_37676 [Filobasidium floriforme]KAH8084010.1 hypothetical protein HD553DRAFT_37676 [Filobasidium floriforme]